MKTSLLVDKNCSVFRCAYTVYWFSSVHHTWVAAVNFIIYMRGFMLAAHLVSAIVIFIGSQLNCSVRNFHELE